MKKLNTIYPRNLQCTLIENVTLSLLFMFFCILEVVLELWKVVLKSFEML
jgi:hypothetical protein